MVPLAPALFSTITATPSAPSAGDSVARRVWELSQEAIRARGLKLAVDDAGAGFAGLQHILRLQPDIIKLDMDLVRHIDTDAARRTRDEQLYRRAVDIGVGQQGLGTVLEAEGVDVIETHVDGATVADEAQPL